jgi:hypothetical protein
MSRSKLKYLKSGRCAPSCIQIGSLRILAMFFGLNVAKATSNKLRVWLASAYRPSLVGELDLLTDWIPTGSSIEDWFEISHPPALTCQVPTEETAVCAEFLDSIFKTDLKTKLASCSFQLEFVGHGICGASPRRSSFGHWPAGRASHQRYDFRIDAPSVYFGSTMFPRRMRPH